MGNIHDALLLSQKATNTLSSIQSTSIKDITSKTGESSNINTATILGIGIGLLIVGGLIYINSKQFCNKKKN